MTDITVLRAELAELGSDPADVRTVALARQILADRDQLAGEVEQLRAERDDLAVRQRALARAEDQACQQAQRLRRLYEDEVAAHAATRAALARALEGGAR